MARKCDICGRGTQVGLRRSHSNVATKRKLKINLQAATVNGKRMRICTKCLKTLNKKNSKK